MFKRKDGRWQEAVTIDGKRHWIAGKTKAEVLRKIAEVKDKQKRAKSPLWEDLAREWWRNLSVEPSTAHSGYFATYNRALEEYRGREANTITPKDISATIARMTREGKWSHRTASVQRRIFSQIFQFGIAEGLIERNPARDAPLPKGLKTERRAEASPEDLQRIMDNISHPDGLAPNIAMFTGLRRGEVLALQWSDIDFERKEIRVNKAVGFAYNSPYLKSTKTQSGERIVPIPPRLLEELKRRKGKGLIFQRDGKPITNTMNAKSFDRFRKAAGISCTLHQLRHAYITRLVEMGLTVKDTQYLAGHSDIHTTLQIYAHVTESHRQEVADRVRTDFAHNLHTENAER